MCTCLLHTTNNSSFKETSPLDKLYSTVRLKRICKHLFCATLNFFSRGSFSSVIFLLHSSVLPLCNKLTAVCVYMGSKSAIRRTIKQPPPSSSNLKLLQSSQSVPFYKILIPTDIRYSHAINHQKYETMVKNGFLRPSITQ